MLVEDTTAFVEQLEVEREDRRAEKRLRRRRQSEVEVLRAEWERRLAAQALQKLEEELTSLEEPAGSSPGRRLLVARRRRVLERRIGSMRARVSAKEFEALGARERLSQVDQSPRRDRPAPGAKVFRLHSAQHHLECSEKRFARLASSQTDLPVLVGRKDGRSWWWYLDRFWWDEEGLDAREVRVIVLDGDLQRKQQAERFARVRETLLGEERPAAADKPLSPIVRFAVWCRHRGRCVDCDTATDVGFDEILPQNGRSRSTRNVELRCERCRQQRAHNQERARVSRAQVAAVILDL